MRSMRPRRGYLMLLALVFGSVFLTVLGALSSFVLTENRVQTVNTSSDRGFALAEAGLEYYRWFLAHYPTDLTNGTGAAGPYTVPYEDPEGGVIGSFTLDIDGNQSCGQITSIDIESTGTPTENAGASRTLSARYARPTVALYSYIINGTVWAGADRVINGPYHSNGGIRMDGTANAPVTSSLSSWLCTSTFGCSPNSTRTGVFGAGPNQTLWSYPTPQVDFAAIAANFGTLKTTAQASGRYFASRSPNNTLSRGYRVTFNGNGTYTVRAVTSTYSTLSIPINDPSETDEVNDETRINGQDSATTYTLPANCGLIYFEDDVWLEGTINTKVTVVAANIVNSGVTPRIVLRDSITYTTQDGTAGLTAIAEGDVLIGPDSPYNMTLNGIFIAQTGAFGRNLYRNSSGTCTAAYEPRGTLTILGTTVSNKRTGTQWNGACGDYGGYENRIDSYDRNLATDPPPFTPSVSPTYRFVDWRED